MNATELRKREVAELQGELSELLKEQFNMRMQQGSGQLARPHLMKQVRRSIARVKTIIAEKTPVGSRA